MKITNEIEFCCDIVCLKCCKYNKCYRCIVVLKEDLPTVGNNSLTMYGCVDVDGNTKRARYLTADEVIKIIQNDGVV